MVWIPHWDFGVDTGFRGKKGCLFWAGTQFGDLAIYIKGDLLFKGVSFLGRPF